MRYVQEIDNKHSFRTEVINDLKDLGVKIPTKLKRLKNIRNDSNVDMTVHTSVFSTPLALVPSIIVDEYGPIPKFLLDAIQIIESHLETEGLYRKSGNFSRQKELKIFIDNGGDLDPCTHPFDVIGLIKQFFRELPDPLLTSQLHDTFVRCLSVESDQVRHMTALLTCLLLPTSHLSTLRYLMRHLQCVASNSTHNKMDIGNLAVCLAPNLLYGAARSEKVNCTEQGKLLQQQTAVVQLLMERATFIGVVSDPLYERVMKYNSTLNSNTFNCSDVDDFERSEVEAENEHEIRRKKKKRRSSSLQGLVSNLSNSFTKWRKGDPPQTNRPQNTSTFSNYVDQSTLNAINNDTDNRNIPVLMGKGRKYAIDDYDYEKLRKRKAQDELSTPFSTIKKKAILQGNSTLGNTPFKPSKYSPTSIEPDMTFSNLNYTSKMASISPNSSKYASNDMSKTSNCFSNTTASNKGPKGVKKIKGFLRRLSGSKEPLMSQASLCDSSVYSHDSTNSQPKMLAGMSASEECLIRDEILPEMTPQMRRRRERTHTAGGSLRRGRPNTLTAGLPANIQGKLRRSSAELSPPSVLDSSILTARKMDADSKGFGSPVKRDYINCNTATFDTSPIQKINGAPVGGSRIDFDSCLNDKFNEKRVSEADDIYEQAIKDMKEAQDIQTKKSYLITDLDDFCSNKTNNDSGDDSDEVAPPIPQRKPMRVAHPVVTTSLTQSKSSILSDDSGVWPHNANQSNASSIQNMPIEMSNLRTKQENDRHLSAYRFPQSPLRCLPLNPSTITRRRTRGTSPVHIPKVFTQVSLEQRSLLKRSAKIPISTQLVAPCAQILCKQSHKNALGQVKRLQPSPSSPAKRAKSMRQFKSPLKTSSNHSHS